MKQSYLMTALGRYEILDKLGTGSMGTVYRARDSVLDREVALKTIRTGIEVEPELRERFYREARACARLQHPSIVVVHDLGEIDQMAYIAMELLAGSDLRRLIEQRAAISLPIKLEFMIQACEALGYAHRHGIIHRDIKPSNLFLTEQNRAKVLDFGIARMPSSKLTVAGRILGTPNYMAPEQILGKPSDTRADLFSAAVVFFEFLVYAHPFKEEVIPRRIVDGEPESLHNHDPKLPVVLGRVFTRAFAKDPAARYRTGDEFAADLKAVLDALARNASPTFSSVQLPSMREILREPRIPALQPNPALLVPPPPGEDPAEWRLSEVMRLIPLFETATDNRDPASARNYLAQLEAIQAIDSRFTEAIQVCKARLGDLEQSVPKVKAHAATAAQSGTWQSDLWLTASGRRPKPLSDTPTTPKSCPHCNASNRSAAVYCIECGARLPDIPPATPSPLRDQPQPAIAPVSIDDPTIIVTPQKSERVPTLPDWNPPPPAASPSNPGTAPDLESPAKAAPQSRSRPAADLRTWVRRQTATPLSQQRLALVAGGGLVCLILMGLVWKVVSAVRLEPSVATAGLAAGRAPVFDSVNGESPVATVLRGDLIHILKMPRNSDSKWVSVQVVHRNRPMRPGYMRTSDLTDWDSPSPENKLALVLLFSTNGSGSPADYQEEESALQRLAEQFPGTRVAREARLDMAEVALANLRTLNANGSPVTEDQLLPVRAYLSEAATESSLAERINQAQQQLDQFSKQLPPAPPVVQPPEPPPPTRSKPIEHDRLIKIYLERADQLWNSKQFDEAENWFNRAAKVQHDHPDVVSFQQKIQDRKKLLEK